MNKVIDVFRDKNFFLSNFYTAPVYYQGLWFENSEAAFQSAKCPERMEEFCGLNPSEAKKLGRKMHLRDDWEEVKEDVMYDVCKAKFTQNPDLALRLIHTGDAELIEGNTWGDKVWGVCDGVGQNLLGKILMRIRDEVTEASQMNIDFIKSNNSDSAFFYVVYMQYDPCNKCVIGGGQVEAKFSWSDGEFKNENRIDLQIQELPYQSRIMLGLYYINSDTWSNAKLMSHVIKEICSGTAGMVIKAGDWKFYMIDSKEGVK